MAKFKPETLTQDKAAEAENEENLVTTNRNFKASLFEQIFNSKSEALSLYNAVNGTDYADENELSITTISGALFMGYHNDVSFLIDSVLSLYEHQSTWNPNMPLRGLSYFARLYENYIKKNQLDIYSSVKLKLPKAQYYVFYNGKEKHPDRQVLSLSDSFPDDGRENHLELHAVMLNINYGHNRELMEKCRTLHDYALFVEKVREYIDMGYQRARAVENAMNDCIRDDVLRAFLIRNQAGVMKMLFGEEDWERHKRLMREEARREGLAEGRAEGLAEGRAEGLVEGRAEGLVEGRIESILLLLSRFGEPSEELYEQIQSEKDLAILDQWLQLAAKTSDMDDFMKQI